MEDNNYVTNDFFNDGIHNTELSSEDEKQLMLSDDDHTSYPDMNNRRRYVIVAVLFLANLLNYFDRSSLLGILIDVKEEFNMNDKGAAMINSVFLITYMIFSPIFGFLGDHYSRKWLIVIGLLFWSLFTFIGSFVPTTCPNLFYFTRSLVGIGEASLSTLGFPLVGDMFEGALQARMLAIYLVALPVGNGIGYIVGTTIQSYFNNWRYVLRLTPALGLFVALLCSIFIQDHTYQRTENHYDSIHNSDSTNVSNIRSKNIITSFFHCIWNDLKYFYTIKSFILSTVGYAETVFVMGIMSVWIPTFMTYAGNVHSTDLGKTSQNAVGLIFGMACIICGLIGTFVGSELSNRIRIHSRNAETYLCAVVLYLCSICSFIGIVVNPYSIIVSWCFIFLGVFLICITWTPNSVILMSVIGLRHRGLASAIQIVFIHTFGDSISPLIVGMISDRLRHDDSNAAHYTSLYYSMLVCPFFMVVAGTFYLWSTFYYPQDKDLVSCEENFSIM